MTPWLVDQADKPGQARAEDLGASEPSASTWSPAAAYAPVASRPLADGA